MTKIDFVVTEDTGEQVLTITQSLDLDNMVRLEPCSGFYYCLCAYYVESTQLPDHQKGSDVKPKF